MVLNPTLNEEFEKSGNMFSDFMSSEPICLDPWESYFRHKETPEQYRARKESMAKRAVKKETPEERESRIAYMKQKAIYKARKDAIKEEYKWKKIEEREELLEEMKKLRNSENEDGKFYSEPRKTHKKKLTELEKHLRRMKKEEDKEKRERALEEARERDRKRKEAEFHDEVIAHYGGCIGYYRIDDGCSRYTSWNVEGN